MTAGFASPHTGALLWPDTPHSIGDGHERWPVVDGIPYLRAGREDLAARALARLDAGDQTGALVVLLADQDGWWDGASPDEASLRRLVAERETLTLREAMGLLAYGRVGDYFAHRWTDPTFVAGLALVEAHWNEPRTAFELACGIGHYLRELDIRGVAVTGVDVVFSKLWLARHWVVGPRASLACFDASRRWPLLGLKADLVLCQDAFYFLEPKAEILSRLRAIAAPEGVLAVGHVHNREARNFSAGAGLSASDMDALFPDASVYDDDELTRAAAEGRAPSPASLDRLTGVEAFSVAAGAGAGSSPRRLNGLMTLPPEGTRLVRNPLYDASAKGGGIAWPSERYRDEYGARATYRAGVLLPAETRQSAAVSEAVRRRELVALPERW